MDHEELSMVNKYEDLTTGILIFGLCGVVALFESPFVGVGIILLAAGLYMNREDL